MREVPAVRQLLVARAAVVRSEPDLVGLRERIEKAASRRQARTRLAVAALVLLAAAVCGVGAGSALVRQHLTRTSLSAETGSDAGRLPAGPPPSAPVHRGIVSFGLPRLSLSELAGRGVVVRRTAGGVRLQLAARLIDPVVVAAGSTTGGCYAGQLVTTTAAAGSIRGGGLAVVGTEPLAPSDLELVGSGAEPVGDGSEMWWATVAVGSDVARVATESPAQGTDAVTPVDGLAVVGGLVPAGEAGRFFSAVAETAAGDPLGSLGFLLGGGSRLDRPSRATGASRSAGCVSAVAAGPRRAPAAAPPSPDDLLAVSAVVAAYHQAYDGTLAGGPSEALSAVAGAARLGPDESGAAPLARTHALSVQVGEVRFVSPSRAEVSYRLAGGEWRTGSAVHGASGGWEVGTVTYCADVLSLPAALRPFPGLTSSCSALLAG